MLLHLSNLVFAEVTMPITSVHCTDVIASFEWCQGTIVLLGFFNDVKNNWSYSWIQAL